MVRSHLKRIKLDRILVLNKLPPSLVSEPGYNGDWHDRQASAFGGDPLIAFPASYFTTKNPQTMTTNIVMVMRAEDRLYVSSKTAKLEFPQFSGNDPT